MSSSNFSQSIKWEINEANLPPTRRPSLSAEKATSAHTCTQWRRHAGKNARVNRKLQEDKPFKLRGRSGRRRQVRSRTEATLFLSLAISQLLQSASCGCHSDSPGIVTRHYGMSSACSWHHDAVNTDTLDAAMQRERGGHGCSRLFPPRVNTHT